MNRLRARAPQLCRACVAGIVTVAGGGPSSPSAPQPTATPEADGRWQLAASCELGQLVDLQAAQDVIDWNMNATGSASYRERGIITRWELPVRVYLQ